MKMTWVIPLVFAGLAVVVGLPLAGAWLRRDEPPRCELEGLAIEPLYRVRVVDRSGKSHSFCCVECARRWLEREGGVAPAVYVTDEVGGAELDARSACFVQSPVVTNPVTGNCTHVFRDRADAEEHVRAFDGLLLAGADRPFPAGAPGVLQKSMPTR
jgi:hypothetical protein